MAKSRPKRQLSKTLSYSGLTKYESYIGDNFLPFDRLVTELTTKYSLDDSQAKWFLHRVYFRSDMDCSVALGFEQSVHSKWVKRNTSRFAEAYEEYRQRMYSIASEFMRDLYVKAVQRIGEALDATKVYNKEIIPDWQTRIKAVEIVLTHEKKGGYAGVFDQVAAEFQKLVAAKRNEIEEIREATKGNVDPSLFLLAERAQK